MATQVPNIASDTYQLLAGEYKLNITLSPDGSCGTITSDIFQDNTYEEKKRDGAAVNLLEGFLIALAIEGIEMRDGRVERALSDAIQSYCDKN